MTDAREMTADELEAVFMASLRARDWQGLHAALTLLAFRDPARAEELYDTLQLGLQLARATS